MGDIVKSNIINSLLRLSPTFSRKLKYILKLNDRINILKEASYYSDIYSGVDDVILLECLINKYIKIRLYNRLFLDIKNDVCEYLKNIEKIYKNKNIIIN